MPRGWRRHRYEHVTGGLWDVYGIDVEGPRERTEGAV